MDDGNIDPKRVSKNMGIVSRAFVKSYGTDGSNVFAGLLKEAGF